jgi:hypothetical protein
MEIWWISCQAANSWAAPLIRAREAGSSRAAAAMAA